MHRPLLVVMCNDGVLGCVNLRNVIGVGCQDQALLDVGRYSKLDHKSCVANGNKEECTTLRYFISEKTQASVRELCLDNTSPACHMCMSH